MPYRLPNDRRAAQEIEARELLAVYETRRAHQRRTLIGVVVGIVGMLSVIPTLASISPPRPKVTCHKVTIQYENAPQLPGDTWQTCTQR